MKYVSSHGFECARKVEEKQMPYGYSPSKGL